MAKPAIDPAIQVTIPTVQLYSRLCDLIYNRPEVIETLKLLEQNLIRFDENKDNPQKSAVQTVDLPEIIVAPVGLGGTLKASTGASQPTIRYIVTLTTGDYRYATYLAPLSFYVYAALTEWADPCIGITELQWNKKPFVRNLTFTDSDVGLSDAARNRGIEGWSELLRFEVALNFKLSELKR